MYAVAFHPRYVHPVPDGHRFPMVKYELLPQQLVHRGIVAPQQFFRPGKAALQHIYRVHDKDYTDRFVQLRLSYHEGRRTGFIQDADLVERELLLVQGTIDGAVRALDDGIAFNIAGGTHHACRAHGEGFCMLNDQAIAAQYLLDHTPVQRVLIVDLDVHQGNGTADIFRGRSEVYTFSMHCEHNYPFHKQTSHRDIGLETGTTDTTYLRLLAENLQDIIRTFRPGFIFYQAGVDILYADKMGKLQCTLEGCKARDRIVMETAYAHGIPVQCSMGGGYAADIRILLEAHTNTYIAANEIFL